jgi:hypothetical protein
LLLAAVTIMVKKKVSQQYYIFFLYFALAITVVSLMANAIVTMMAMAPAMIYHHLFYDSYDNSGNYVYIFLR